MIKKYVGSKDFYKMVLIIAIPIMIQDGFTNFVNLLDNLMVGRIGTDEMSGVAIINQLIFVFTLTLFGGLSGAGIYVSQYHGSGNKEGIRNIFKIKLLIAVSTFFLGTFILLNFQDKLISYFLYDGSKTGDPILTMKYAKDYLNIMLIGLLPFSLSQCVSSTLKEVGQTVIPMKASVSAVVINLTFNYFLIFGKFGFPKLGVKGAAIATVLSRFVELAILIIWSILHKSEYDFVKPNKDIKLTPTLAFNVFKTSLPLLVNELLWSGGMTMLSQCYATRGLAAVGAVSIASTMNNIFNISFLALGSSISIVVGKELGAGDLKKAKDTDNKMIAFSVASCLIFSVLMIAFSPLFPKLYNTTDEVRYIATNFIRIMAVAMPFYAFNHAAYFTIRSGGKTFITMLFDCCFVWIFCVPTAFILSRYTALAIIPLYALCQCLDVLKAFFGYFALRSNIWIQTIANK